MKKCSLITGMIFLFVMLTFTWSFAQRERLRCCGQEIERMNERILFPEKVMFSQEEIKCTVGCCYMVIKKCRSTEVDLGCCKREFFLCSERKLELTDEQVAALKSLEMETELK